MQKHIIVTIFLLISFFGNAQIDTVSVKSIEGITNKMIELISGAKDEPRNWDEYRSLFLPRAQKIFINRKAPPKKQIRVMNLEEFVRNVGPLYKRDGFEEISLGLTINEYNGIANVFQSYYCKNLIGTYEKRGINSYQLIYANDRWWIASTTFTNETEDNKIPNRYLSKENQSKN
ncbi:hypothetical protein [Aquimarina sp. 2304DJ70-9]|uniref:hypothetical protein n=1 Tax=Aquimarina penaris TaxID=3231044 RepID=UPI0034617C67